MARAASLFVNLGLESASFINGLKRATAETNKAMQSIQRSIKLVTAGFGALGGGMVLSALSGTADAWSDMSSRVGLAVGDMEKAPAMMREIADVADRTYSSLELTAEAFIANRTALGDLGYGISSTLKYTEALNSALVVSGAKGDVAARVQDQLSKAMATGSLKAKGLETVLAGGGRVAQALAEKLGTSVSGLRKMASEGKITSDVIAGALIDSFQRLQEEAESMPATIGDGFLKIRNAIGQLIGEADKAVGMSENIGKALVNVSKVIKDNIPIILEGFQMVASAMTALALLAGGRFAVAVGQRVAMAFVMAGGAAGVFAIALRAIPFMLVASAAVGLVHGFINLVRATGGVGAAFSAVWDTAKQFFAALKLSVSGTIDQLTALGWSVRGIFSKDARKRATELLGEAADKFAQSGQLIIDAGKDMWAKVKEGSLAAGLAIKGATEDADELGKTLGGLSDEELKKLAAAAKKFREEWEALQDRLLPWRAPTREYYRAIEVIGIMEQRLRLAAGAFDELRQAARGQWLDALGFDKAGPAIAKMKNDLSHIGDGLRKSLAGIGEDIKKTIDDLNAPYRRAAEFGEKISQNLAQAVVYGQSLGTALVNSIKAAVAEAMASQIARALFGAGIKGDSGLLGGLLGGIFGGFRAAGGPVSPGKAYLVGEKGPELLVPGHAGRVLSNTESFGGGGGTITFDLRGAVMTEDLLEQMNMMAIQSGATAVSMVRGDMARSRQRSLARGFGA